MMEQLLTMVVLFIAMFILGYISAVFSNKNTPTDSEQIYKNGYSDGFIDCIHKYHIHKED